MSSEEEFRSNLVELVKAMGQEMIDRAEDIVGNGDVLHSLTVTIDFPIPTFEEAPTLNVSRDYYSRRCFDLILNDFKKRKKKALSPEEQYQPSKDYDYKNREHMLGRKENDHD